jgi:hypothetical protein
VQIFPSRLVATIVLSGLVFGPAGTAAAKKPKPQPCPPGRFLVDPAVTPLLPGVSPTDALDVDAGGHVALDGCGTAGFGAVKATRAFTKIKAKWDQCGTFTRILLTAKILSPSCEALGGKIRARKLKPKPFAAARSTTTTTLCVDADGDGWTTCDGDCCDTPSAGCPDPALENPGAFEVPGNLVDDDCDGTVDNVPAPCDVGLASDSATALDYARAIDLCQTTTDTPPTLAERRWGVIAAELLRADGTGAPAAASRAIRPGFGSGVVPQSGSSLVILSTGNAAAPGDTNPSFVSFQPGLDTGVSSAAPADWLAANGGTFPNAPGCPPAAGTTANDPVMLKLRVRVPTNAKSFSVRTFFYSAEYPEWVCSPYNDVFLALLDSGFAPGNGESFNPVDKNLAFFRAPNSSIYPVDVNLAFGNTGLFQQCVNGGTGCAGAGSPLGTTSTCVGTSQLVGTGFDGSDPGMCSPNSLVGGGTGWLTTSGNVSPGETIDLRFVIWDTTDHGLDSLVLLDDWVWSTTTTGPGTTD